MLTKTLQFLLFVPRCPETDDSDEMSKDIGSDVSPSMCLRLYAMSYRDISKDSIRDNILFINRDISLKNFKVRNIKINILKKIKDRNIKL